MKTLITLFSCCCFGIYAQAANLTATVLKATAGKKNGKITLAISGGNAPFTFSWTGPSGYKASWQNPDSLGAGTYCVTVTDRYCGKATLCVSLGENPNSIASITGSDLKIYPNPFKDRINIQPGTAMQGRLQARLFDISGKNVAEKMFERQEAITWELDQHLAPGTYLLLLQDESGLREQSLLIRRED